MSKRWITAALLLMMLTALIPPAAAQTPEAQRIELEASDGLILVGLYYALPDPHTPAPAILLMHHGGSQKESWIDFIPDLLAAGYATLTIDLRGHGETDGTFDAELAQDDAHRWLAWLREQPGVDPERVNIVGASMGGDVGLPVYAADEALASMVSLSPALEFEGINTNDAVAALGDRPIFLVAGQGAVAEADAVRTLMQTSEGNVQARLYNNDACCTFFFMLERDLAPSIIGWLDEHNGLAEVPALEDQEPQRVEAAASDDLMLVGNYFTPAETPDGGAPAVLLLHQYGSQKQAWDIALVTPLLDAGYAVLAVDQRGFGDTGGGEDWELAELDVQTWLDWLREQPGIDPERLNIVGASIGSNLALRSMANDERVVTAVALSPGLDYFGVTTEEAITAIGERPVYLVAAQHDSESADAVRTLGALAAGEVRVRIYTHSAHGTGMFMLEYGLAPSIVAWLDAYN